MKISAVIGNPPYNNDMYIPFVEMGHQLASECSVFITPAKWQAKGGKVNEAFRQNIVPHMSKIVYYPDCLDVFGISEHSGISYYILDKDIHNEKEIVNKCNQVKYFNNVYNRGINRESTLYNIGDNIHKKFTYKVISMKKIYNCTKKYLVHTNKLTAGPGHFSIKEQNKNGKWVLKHDVIGNGGFKFNVNTHDTNVVSECEIIENTQADIYMLSGSRVIIFESDSIDECKSFISFIDTKIVRFLVLIGIFQQDIINDESWRFVPDPGAFDHIFTDEELYKRYNLTEEEINIIESVIKERK